MSLLENESGRIIDYDRRHGDLSHNPENVVWDTNDGFGHQRRCHCHEEHDNDR